MEHLFIKYFNKCSRYSVKTLNTFIPTFASERYYTFLSTIINPNHSGRKSPG